MDNEYDLSLSKYKEEVYTAIAFESPSVMLKKLTNLEKQIGEGIKELEKLIK